MSAKTSIILCTYNEAHHIKNTVLQIKKIIKNLELIIVDDNSNDGTKEILEQLNQEKEFKIIFRKDLCYKLYLYFFNIFVILIKFR